MHTRRTPLRMVVLVLLLRTDPGPAVRGALSVVRGVQYFGDRGNGPGLLCLAIWAVAGLALLCTAGLRRARHGPLEYRPATLLPLIDEELPKGERR